MNHVIRWKFNFQFFALIFHVSALVEVEVLLSKHHDDPKHSNEADLSSAKYTIVNVGAS